MNKNNMEGLTQKIATFLAIGYGYGDGDGYGDGYGCGYGIKALSTEPAAQQARDGEQAGTEEVNG